jgi:hypothetical protein
MDYESLERLDQLLTDSSAVEFRAVLPEIPVNLFADDFYQWAAKDGPDNWEEGCLPMFGALSRLVKAEPSYDVAMAEISKLQDSLRPEVAEPEDVADEPEQVIEEPEVVSDEPVVTQVQEDPREAAKAAAETIGPTIIEKLLQRYPDFASRLSPEELAKIAMESMGEAISEKS